MNHEPEALQLARELDTKAQALGCPLDRFSDALRHQHARIAELEAQLYAVGAGGVGQSIKPQVQADTAQDPARQPLTDEQILSIVRIAPALDTVEAEFLHIARAVEAAVAKQPARQPLPAEAFTALAHRIASKYTHRSDPSFSGYAFLPHTLEQFVRAIEAAHGITGGQP